MALFDRNQRTRLILAQQHRCRNDLIDEIFLLVSGQGRHTGEDIRLSKPLEYRADLRLEDNDDRKKSPVNENIRYIRYGFQSQERR